MLSNFCSIAPTAMSWIEDHLGSNACGDVFKLQGREKINGGFFCSVSNDQNGFKFQTCSDSDWGEFPIETKKYLWGIWFL